MLKRILLAIFPLTLLLLTSCGQKAPVKDSPPFLQEVEYAVGIKAEGLKTKGLFCYKSNGTFTFTFQDESTPINGLKETVSEDEILTEYGGIQWRSDEVTTTFSRVCRILSNFENASLVAKERTTFRGYDAIHLTYTLDEGTLHLWKKAEDQTTLSIRREAESLPFTLSFITE